MTSPNTTIYTPFADGRPVRDIVEHTPALVDETWCRNLLRHVLDSLDRQYASGAPHRAITPDSVVMLANGDALLMPSIGEASAAEPAPNLPADLQSLALVVHYAITAELPPDGPLGPRLYDNYSEQLTKGLDSCLGPNRRLRPQTVDDMRVLLGVEAGAVEIAPAAAPAPAEFVEPAPVPPLTDEPPPANDFAAPAISPVADDNPVPEPLAMAAQPDAPVAAAPAPESTDPLASEPVNLRELAASGMLRKPANQDAAAGGFTQAPRSAERLITPPLHERVEPAPAATHKPSAAIPVNPRAGAPAAQSARRRNSRAQRWGMIAGAAIVVLAAGGALFSYMQQNDARDLAPLSLPPAERAATGLDAGETVLAPPSGGTAVAPATDAHPLDGTPEAAPGAAPATGLGPTAPIVTQGIGGTNDAVINGTTYKLLIKPWGTVYVNGVDRGVSPPVKRLTLGPGQHTIRLANPNFPEHIMTVESGLRETETIEHDFTAQAD